MSETDVLVFRIHSIFFFLFSMGGHGALICFLKNPGKYRSVSAFSAICNPSNGKWGRKAFSTYLGSADTSEWASWDASELVKKYNGPPVEILLDQVIYYN